MRKHTPASNRGGEGTETFGRPRSEKAAGPNWEAKAWINLLGYRTAWLSGAWSASTGAGVGGERKGAGHQEGSTNLEGSWLLVRLARIQVWAPGAGWGGTWETLKATGRIPLREFGNLL